MNTNGRNCNRLLARDYATTQSSFVDTDEDFNYKNEIGTSIKTLTFAFEALTSHITTIITKLKKSGFLIAEFQHELIEDLQSLILNIQATQISSLEIFNNISKVNIGYHEQLNLFHSQLSQKIGNYNQQAKNSHDTQRTLSETRNRLNVADRKYQILDHEWRCVENDLKTRIRNLEFQLKCEREFRQKSYKTTNTYSTDSSALNYSIGPSLSRSLAASIDPPTNKVSNMPKNRKLDTLSRGPSIKLQAFNLNPISSKVDLTYAISDESISALKLKNGLQFNPSKFAGNLSSPELGEDSEVAWSYSTIKGCANRNLVRINKLDAKLYNPLYTSEDDFSPEFRVLFDKLLGMIELWCKTFAYQPNKENDSQIPFQDSLLWAYMMDFIYPGDKDASEQRVRELISLSSTRYWFVMRMATTYIFNNVLSLENFHGFLDITTERLVNFEARMKKRGMSALDRQKLIGQRDAAIKAIIKHGDYNKWRSFKLNQHIKYLHDIVGPLLAEECNRIIAGRDLSSIAISAFELSTKIHSSGLTFQILFPEMGSKFNANTMIARDRAERGSLVWRVGMKHLKLVISPMITMRNDQGSSIKAKSLQLATVLTMA